MVGLLLSSNNGIFLTLHRLDLAQTLTHGLLMVYHCKAIHNHSPGVDVKGCCSKCPLSREDVYFCLSFLSVSFFLFLYITAAQLLSTQILRQVSLYFTDSTCAPLLFRVMCGDKLLCRYLYKWSVKYYDVTYDRTQYTELSNPVLKKEDSTLHAFNYILLIYTLF